MYIYVYICVCARALTCAFFFNARRNRGFATNQLARSDMALTREWEE